MGILDDAIRQHLDLKRQHGAPEEELQRQEEEALGPARREVAPAEMAGGDGEVELDEAAEADPDAAADADAVPAPDAQATEFEAEPDLEPHEQATVLQEPDAPAEPLVESDSAADPEATAEHPPPAPYDAASDLPDFDEEDEVPADEEDEVPADEALEPATPAAPSEDEASATDSFGDPEDEREDLFADEDDDEPEAQHGRDETPEDVLEDTPDFLQETPEHDRLWFEQKPPRDFDFD
jgi:hypothetical protein